MHLTFKVSASEEDVFTDSEIRLIREAIFQFEAQFISLFVFVHKKFISAPNVRSL